MPSPRQALVGVAIVVAFVALFSVPPARHALEAFRALPQTIDAIDPAPVARPIGRALGAAVRDHPAQILGVLVAAVVVPRVRTGSARSPRS